MITGETESILSRELGSECFDNLFGIGGNKPKKKKKKQLTAEQLAAKKEKRKQFWSNIGQSFEEGGTVSNILGMFGGGGGAPLPSDYEISMGEQARGGGSGGGGQPDQPQKAGIPTGVMIVGGLILLGVAYVGYTQYQKNQQNQQQLNQGQATQ